MYFRILKNEDRFTYICCIVRHQPLLDITGYYCMKSLITAIKIINKEHSVKKTQLKNNLLEYTV